MKIIAKIFLIATAVSIVTACCDRRCSVHKAEIAVPVDVQEKLTKMKEQAGGKGSK